MSNTETEAFLARVRTLTYNELTALSREWRTQWPDMEAVAANVDLLDSALDHSVPGACDVYRDWEPARSAFVGALQDAGVDKWIEAARSRVEELGVLLDGQTAVADKAAALWADGLLPSESLAKLAAPWDTVMGDPL